MRISDWSADVCSSDLDVRLGRGGGLLRLCRRLASGAGLFFGATVFLGPAALLVLIAVALQILAAARFLKRPHARLFGLAQQLRLTLLAGEQVVARRLWRTLGRRRALWGGRVRSEGAWCGRGGVRWWWSRW